MLAEYLPSLYQLCLIQFLGVLTPGADTLLVLQAGVSQRRLAGLSLVTGIAAGVLVHSSWILLFFTKISNIKVLIEFVRWAGCAYLCYLGFLNIKASKKNGHEDRNSGKQLNDSSILRSFCKGLFTNLLNPKVIVYFSSVFILAIDLEAPRFMYIAYGATGPVISALWFSTLLLMASNKKVTHLYQKHQTQFNFVSGLIFIFFATLLFFFEN